MGQSTAELNMSNKFLLSSFLLVVLMVAEGLGEGYAPGDYRPDIGHGPPTDYGRPTTPNCHMEQRTDFIDRCLPYEETTCYSQNEEDCKEYYANTCTPIVNTEVDRRCFNVTELICELVESITYKQVEENFHVQSCYTTKDRICDTVHEIDTTTKDDLQCIELETPNCHMEDKILVDKVCTDTVEFECSPDKKLDNAGYGVKDTECREVPKHDCYASPRKPRSTRTRKIASRSRASSATSARPRPWSRPACGRNGSRASTPPGLNARSRQKNTAIRPRSQRWLKCATIS